MKTSTPEEVGKGLKDLATRIRETKKEYNVDIDEVDKRVAIIFGNRNHYIFK
ncbi:hypothetical protein MKY92_09600 [Paenibacillus sp. FSL R5-0623]|uniref:hypothetical protein n=1 Tax=Paenibacillus sp. FSL R5-0623 TaxID=2921651 RepID=UPI0030DA99B8